MTSQQLLSRAFDRTGTGSFQQEYSSRLLYSIHAAPYVKFDSKAPAPAGVTDDEPTQIWAHRPGVNTLSIEHFESRFLLTGGADSSIGLWDLTVAQCSGHPSSTSPVVHRPVTLLPKSSHGHQYGITHVSWYPFDSLAFLSSSYDHKLNLYATPTLSPSSPPAASFTLPDAINSHALSPIASHLLAACATRHPAVRLVDLKSNATTHALSGHGSSVMSVAWSPRDEHILASAGADGSVRLWDIRRSAASLGTLDLDDSEGVLGTIMSGDTSKASLKNSDNRRAHVGACNGIAWTDSGEFLVSAGHDARIRVWDMATGANTLAHFGPKVRNSALNTVLPVVVSGKTTGPGREILFFPSGDDILVCNLREGDTIKRLRMSPSLRSHKGGGGGSGGKGLVKAVALREGYCEAYSAHADGVVRSWWPRTDEDIEAEQEEEDGEREKEEMAASEENERKRKRAALGQIYRDLTRQKITFT